MRRACKGQELQARNSHPRSLWAPCPNVSQQRPTPPFPSGTEPWRGHSDSQSENWLLGDGSGQEPLNPNCQPLTLLQIATFLLEMKLLMKRWFPAEGLRLRVNCLQASTLQGWPFPSHLFFLSLPRSWLMLESVLGIHPYRPGSQKSQPLPFLLCMVYNEKLLKCLNSKEAQQSSHALLFHR